MDTATITTTALGANKELNKKDDQQRNKPYRKKYDTREQCNLKWSPEIGQRSKGEQKRKDPLKK